MSEQTVKKDQHPIETLEAWTGAEESPVYDSGTDRPIKTLLLSGLDSTPVLKLKIYDGPTGVSHDTYKESGAEVIITVTGTTCAIFLAALGGARYFSILADSSQTDVVAKLIRSS